ncbi:hypothetical protein CAP36_11940 [Chitinophagaceae bacterium IBVUCB2]|nr:hypothetical protein CAP36_11940 [Chitinophagaceae bacterium IBVUCB2]
MSLFFFALVISSQTFAQHGAKGHAHAAGPHGGTVESATEGYHSEMVTKNAKLYFYLLDANGKTAISKAVTGEVLLQFADGTTKTVMLTSSGEGFVVNDPKATTFANAIVTFQNGGKTVSVKFKAPAKAADNHNHQH